ncbi:DNA repair protein rev1 [Hypsizygus marmoreus]|uniref:DNA repair protein REV1 n=1 Tax=Hypsizygus marmoreus TaxID=39966 RepID=A0A369JIQ2_HYPMA|nr:DNA repair protein rev1 [Hypsizygus marmoreus]
MDLPGPSQSNSSDYFEEDDSAFLEALETAVLPGDVKLEDKDNESPDESQELAPPPPSQPSLKRRRLEAFEERSKSRQDQVQDEAIYGASHFGDFGEYMRRKRAKLQIQNAEIEDDDGDSASESRIFQGLAIYINGYTQPSVQELRGLIVKCGGIFQPYLDKKSIVTHIITCSLTPNKIREFKHMKVVRPEWLVESARAGVLLPFQDFIFIPDERQEDSQGSKTKQTNLSKNSRPTTSAAALRDLYKTPPRRPVPQVSALNFNKNVRSRPVFNPPKPVEYPQEPPKEPPGYADHISNPIAERVMANPEWRKAHTSVAPDFIEGFYKNSRLHHLSTWKAELKNLVQEAQERAEVGGVAGLVAKVESEAVGHEGGVSMRGAELVMKSPGKGKGKGKERAVDDRVIMHCDFDCFFVSAGLLSRPQLKGKPVVVCHSQGAQGGASSTSEVASASYEARKFGIKNGMSLQQARKLCPGIITIPYEFETYKQLSLKFYTILMSHADDLQAVSVDEALIEVTGVVTQLRSRSSPEPGALDPAKDFAEAIRAQVRTATGCEVSIGISHNILLARLATRRAKPAGSYHLVPAEVEDFLAPLSISDLHGFGWSMEQKAQEKLGNTTLGELMDKSKAVLCDAMGKTTGETLYNALRGIDHKSLESDKPRKSVSCEINYGIRFENNQQAEAFIYQMATEVTKRLDDIGMLGRSITLKIMKRDPTAPVEPPKFLGHGACDLYNKQIPLIGAGGRATNDERVIGEHAWRMLRSFNFDPKELRGIGIQIQRLEHPTAQKNLQPGQAMLQFRRVESPKKAGPPPPADNKRGPQIFVCPPSVGAPEALPNQSPTKPTVVVDLPTFSQVDMDVFNALPADVRKELEDEYKRRSASPSRAGGPAAPAQPIPAARPAAAPNIFPKKITVKGTNFKRIARQLRPNNPAVISPQKNYAWQKSILMKKKGRAGASKLSDAALRDLDIDPEVFRMLPPALQHEQLARLRILKERGSLPDSPTQRQVLKPRKRKPIPEHLLWRAPAPRARFVAPPILRQQLEKPKKKLLFTETDDIQRAIEGWVHAYRRWVPKEKDIEFFTKYLVTAVDGKTHGDASVERAVAVLKWWLVLLRRYWGGSEYVDDEGYMDPSPGDPVGEAWWKTFREVKAKMDAVFNDKFGGKLSLR